MTQKNLALKVQASSVGAAPVASDATMNPISAFGTRKHEELARRLWDPTAVRAFDEGVNERGNRGMRRERSHGW